jgi:hypothetical protein
MPVIRTNRTPKPMHHRTKGQMPSRQLLAYGGQVRGMLQTK